MKKILCFVFIITILMLAANGSEKAYAGGGNGAALVGGIFLGGLIFGGIGGNVYYNAPQEAVAYCAPWYGQIVCSRVVTYNDSPPFYPGYSYQSWYTIPAQPGFVFFVGHDGHHHRHEFHQRTTGYNYRTNHGARAIDPALRTNSGVRTMANPTIRQQAPYATRYASQRSGYVPQQQHRGPMNRR